MATVRVRAQHRRLGVLACPWIINYVLLQFQSILLGNQIQREPLILVVHIYFFFHACRGGIVCELRSVELVLVLLCISFWRFCVLAICRFNALIGDKVC